MFGNKLLVIITAAWFGAYLMAGYGVAPLLFQNLPQAQAGILAGILFDAVNYGGIAVMILLLLCGRTPPAAYGRNKRSLSRILLGTALLLLSFSQLFLTPVIKALRSGGHHWLSDALGGSFAMWHGLSSSVYLLVSLVAVWILARLFRFEWQ